MTTTQIQILRGADTIGGSCIKIKNGPDYIILDYGKPLMESGGGTLPEGAVSKPTLENNILLDVVGGDEQAPLAFIISHGHPDHYGLIDHVEGDVPIYVSETCLSLLEVGNMFYRDEMRVKNIHQLSTYVPQEPFTLGPFTIKAFPMDHSAFGACSLLITVGDKRIYYTGDFRGHGRWDRLLEPMIAEISGVDVMLMEGTTMDSGHPSTFSSERAVEDAVFEKISADHSPVFVAGSGSNIDRIVSLYEATKRACHEFVIDLYQLYMLEKLNEHDPTLPPHDGDHLRVFYPGSQAQTIANTEGSQWLYRHKNRQLKVDDMDLERGRYVFRLSNHQSHRVATAFMDVSRSPKLVYSMWQGYMQQQKSFEEIAQLVGSEWTYIHTSGHAYLEYLKQLTARIKPRTLIPIHTLVGDDFKLHFDNVVRVYNGETFTL